MMIWIILLAMTAAAVMAVLWPLSRHRAVSAQVDPDTQFYREQIAEIERDRARGVLLPSEAEAAKAEAGTTSPAGDGRPRQRLCRRRRAGPAPPPRRLDPGPVDHPDPRARDLRRSTARRNLPSPPRAARSGRDNVDLVTAVAQIETHLAQEPAGRPRLGGHRSGLSPHGSDGRCREGL